MTSAKRKTLVTSTSPKKYCELCKQEFGRDGRKSPWKDNDPLYCSPCLWALMGKKEISQEQQQQQQQQEHQQKDNEDDYCYPWLKRDRLVAHQLMKHEISMYDCDAAKQFLEPYDCEDDDGFVSQDDVEWMLGRYDVVFGRFESHFDYSDPDYCYFHKHNILRKQTMGGSFGFLFCDAGGRFGGQKLLGNFLIDAPYPGIVAIVPTHIYCANCDTHDLASSRNDGALREIQTLSQDVELDWIPQNGVAGDSEYARAVRHAIDQERRRPLLWLCRHKDIPEDVSTIVRDPDQI